jgi:hypothetical protein
MFYLWLFLPKFMLSFMLFQLSYLRFLYQFINFLNFLYFYFLLTTGFPRYSRGLGSW